ncbi:MAG: glycosyltransferase [Candidatus Falkowbacteria bacterium]
MTNLKILLIITKGEVGGAQVSVYNLAKGLKQKGHNVTVAFGKGNFLENKLKTEKINLVNFKNLLRTNNIFKNFLFLFEIKKFLDNNKFDIAHFNSANALFGAVGAKLSRNKPKTIFTVHGLSVLDKNYKTSFLIKKLYYLFFKIFLKFIDKTIFVSNANLKVAAEIGIRTLSDKPDSVLIPISAAVIYNGIDKNNLNFLSKKQALNFLSNKLNINLSNFFIIGSVGRLAYPKNYEFLINNFLKIKEINSKIKLIIIGDGPDKLKYQKLIKQLELNDNIYLTGSLENASRYLKAFDLFVLPSIYEGLPITLIECLMTEIPVLVSNVGGNKEIVEDKRYLYALNNKTEFLEKIGYILNNLDKFQVSDVRKNKFSLDKMVKKYEEVYIN